VHAQPAYARVADLPKPVDLAFVMVPTPAVLDVLTQVADHGITPYGLPIDRPLLSGPVGVVLRYLIDDGATRVIALFIESVRHPAEFTALAREALARGKPVVALKVGRSQQGARVAKAHIGPLPGNRFGFVTASGGASEIIADRAEDEGIEIPEFEPETTRRLREIAPAFATIQNPVDVTGYVLIDRQLRRNALAAVRDDPNLDAVVLVADLPRSAPPDPSVVIEAHRQTSEVLRDSAKPMIVMGTALADITEFGRDIVRQTGYPGVLGGVHHGLTALGHAVRWSRRYRAASGGQPTASGEQPTASGEQPTASQRQSAVSQRQPAVPAADAPVPDVAARPGPSWSEHRASALLADQGIPVVPGVLATDPRSAAHAADAFGYPVVVKLAADGIELLVGIVTDPAWGKVLAVGLGGLWVEILRDTALNVLPVSREEILASLRSLRGARLFDGARGTEKADLDARARGS
jgi:acyl-CoA synthetase (NDP forming)